MTTDVRFASRGLTLAGQLHAPDSGSTPTFPAIVIGHQVTGVKEQAPANYAKRLVKEGYVILTFDAAYQGDGEGDSHGLEDSFQRAGEFRNAVSYLSTRGQVDSERIGVLGVCGSGGYVPYAAQTDHRMKSVATVVAIDIADLFRQPDPGAFQRMVAEASKLRSQEAVGMSPKVIEALLQLNEVDESTSKSVREFVDYYKTPGATHVDLYDRDEYLKPAVGKSPPSSIRTSRPTDGPGRSSAPIESGPRHGCGAGEPRRFGCTSTGETYGAQRTSGGL